ncbi:MAG: hypothetical protein ABEJ73_11935 [Haloplanus sp.]
MPSPEPYDHVTLTDTGHPDGIYRVVGTNDGTVTLLHVADGDGCRINTGELVTVSADEFERVDPAGIPTVDRSFGGTAVGALGRGYGSLRAFGAQLAAHPLPSSVAAFLVVVGVGGDRLGSVPDLALGGLILVGSLGLAYIGGGHL